MKNRFFKTLKLYLRIAINPITAILALVILVGIPIAMIYDPAPLGDKEYMSMIGSVGIGHIGIVCLLIYCGIVCSTSKFFISVPDAKRFMTVMPIIVSAAMGIIYDAVMFVIGVCFLEKQTVSDLLLICPSCTVLASLVVSTLNRKGLGIVDIIACFLLFSTIFVFNGGHYTNGFGISVEKALMIVPFIYILGFALNFLIQKIWWSKSDRLSARLNSEAAFAPVSD